MKKIQSHPPQDSAQHTQHQVITLSGDPNENFYQLGVKERDSFFKLEEQLTKLLSANFILRESRKKMAQIQHSLKENQSSFFYDCISSYAEGLGISTQRYFSFLYIFELASHKGHEYPELKAIIPGCLSLFYQENENNHHLRLLDFPLVNDVKSKPRIYHWNFSGKPSLLHFGFEGMAPLFFQGVHQGGFSFSLHHKPGEQFLFEGHSIFHIFFDSLFNSLTLEDFKKAIRNQKSISKWGIIIGDEKGEVLEFDCEGHSLHKKVYDLQNHGPFIFSNIPLKHGHSYSSDHLISISHLREMKAKTITEAFLKKEKALKKDTFLLNDILNINHTSKPWSPHISTLSTIAAYDFNLSKGIIDFKEGFGALCSSDRTMRLTSKLKLEVLEKKSPFSPDDHSWKHASWAQAFYDLGQFDQAYHHLQMAECLSTDSQWSQIYQFFIYVWDFKMITNNKERSLIYKNFINLKVPDILQTQKNFMTMRMEKSLQLQITIQLSQIPPKLQKFFDMECHAPLPLFKTWMALIYPRLEILDILSPHFSLKS